MRYILFCCLGTESQLLTKRRKDKSKMGFSNWPFMSVHFWGERPEGTWKLAVTNGGEHKGKLKKATLVLYGH
jgi:subtilisin-like proprotein convertase family protein